jgi:hypothetical protein
MTWLSVYPVARFGQSWRYLLGRHTLSRRGAWHGLTVHPRPGGPFEYAVEDQVRDRTGLVTTAVTYVDYSFRRGILEVGAGCASLPQEVIEQVFLAYVEPGRPGAALDVAMEWRWHTYADALEALEWREHIEALEQAHRVVLASAAPLVEAAV